MAKTKTHSVRTSNIPVYKVINGEWCDFYKDVSESTKLARLTYNRMLSRLAASDDQSYKDYASGKKIGKMSKNLVEKSFPYNSNESSNFPNCAQTCASLGTKAFKTYVQSRFQIIRGQKTLPIQRSTPWSLPTQSGFTVWQDDGKWYAKIKLLSQTWTIELKSGSNYAYHINLIKRALENDDKAIRDSTIRLDKKGKVIIGTAVRYPIKQKKTGGSTFKVSTSLNAFLVCVKEKSRIPFTFNADQVKKWQNERKRKQQRLQQDKKYDRKTRKYINIQQDRVSQKYNNRMKTLCHTTAKEIVNKAVRLDCAKIELDTTVRSYMPDFPWYDFVLKIQQKCDQQGIELVNITSEIIPPDIDNDPHVYFFLPVEYNGKHLNRIKIGQTSTKNQERERAIAAAGGYNYVILCADKQPKTKLIKKEKEYHAKFAHCKIILDNGEEWFKLGSVLEWMREVQCLGNIGNLSQIAQVIEV